MRSHYLYKCKVAIDIEVVIEVESVGIVQQPRECRIMQSDTI